MTLEESVKKAKMYVGQLEDELVNLMDIYHIGNPRKEGILMKITGAKDALDEINIEKPKPVKKEEPKTKTETKKPSTQSSFKPTKSYSKSKK